MAGLGWGKRDTTTREERESWKANAQAQMDQQAGRDNDDDDSTDTPGHRRARRPW